MSKAKRWILSQSDPERSREIAGSFNLSPLIAQILINRDLQDSNEIQKFLMPSLAHLPDPSEMKGMGEATARIIQAIRGGELITIYGDYDVDGTTSTVLLMEFLQGVGAKVEYYIPHRIKEGYSLNASAVRHLASGGTKVMITVDNGISAFKEIGLAQSLGLDVIITDHHEPPEKLPPACAILNPKQAGCTFPGKELAGVGVAYYLLIGLRRALREAELLGDREPNLRKCLDLVAVGTIADLAPLKGLNRILVKEGLKVLSETTRLGLRALMEVSAVDGPVRSDQVAFRLGPRINAVGRMEDAGLGVKLLLSDDKNEAQALAERLDQANISRRELEDEITQEAMDQIHQSGILDKYKSIVLYQPHWHSGVVGIVASRLVDRFYRPTILLTQTSEGLKGSARSIRGFHLVDALKACESHLSKFGGHAYAAGLALEASQLEPFREAFDRQVQSKLKEEDFQPSLSLDVGAQLDDLSESFLEQLSRLEPFGLGNPTPHFLLKSAQVRSSRIVGEKHLKLRLRQGARTLGAIGFGLGPKQPEVESQVDLVGHPEWNEWNGNKNIEIRVLDLKDSLD